jgi:hypothetical protein
MTGQMDGKIHKKWMMGRTDGKLHEKGPRRPLIYVMSQDTKQEAKNLHHYSTRHKIHFCTQIQGSSELLSWCPLQKYV